MINGISKYSRKGYDKAISYFLADEYRSTRRIPPPTLLRGNPEQIKRLCNSLKFSHKYTSGVLSFTAEETEKILKDENLKEKIIDEFEEFAFAGVPQECRSILAVQHLHTGRLEIHYLIPRVHLGSLKYFNPFPPLSRLANDAFIDLMALRYELDNPRDPARRRGLRISPYDTSSDIKKAAHDVITKYISEGYVNNSEDVKQVFKEAGARITRHGENYISIMHPSIQKPIRFKGDIYGKNFSIENLRDELKNNSGSSKGGIEKASEKYQRFYESRRKFNQERHKGNAMQYNKILKQADIDTRKINSHAKELQTVISNLNRAFDSNPPNSNNNIDEWPHIIEKVASPDHTGSNKAELDLTEAVLQALKALLEILLSLFGIKTLEEATPTARMKILRISGELACKAERQSIDRKSAANSNTLDFSAIATLMASSPLQPNEDNIPIRMEGRESRRKKWVNNTPDGPEL